jgi:hypothetical protein
MDYNICACAVIAPDEVLEADYIERDFIYLHHGAFHVVNLRHVVNTLQSLLIIRPIFIQTITFALIIAYAFAILGYTLFGTHSDYFETPCISVFTMLQLFFGVEFRRVVEDTVSRTAPAAYVFFLCYHVIGVLIVMNLIKSIIIQFYVDSLNKKSILSLSADKEKHKQLQERLLSRLHQKEVWKRLGLSDFGVVIEQPVGGGVECMQVTKEDLEKCISYTNIDILKKFEQYKV